VEWTIDDFERSYAKKKIPVLCDLKPNQVLSGGLTTCIYRLARHSAGHMKTLLAAGFIDGDCLDHQQNENGGKLGNLVQGFRCRTDPIKAMIRPSTTMYAQGHIAQQLYRQAVMAKITGLKNPVMALGPSAMYSTTSNRR
jgi:hypothetical protein